MRARAAIAVIFVISYLTFRVLQGLGEVKAAEAIRVAGQLMRDDIRRQRELGLIPRG